MKCHASRIVSSNNCSNYLEYASFGNKQFNKCRGVVNCCVDCIKGAFGGAKVVIVLG